MARARRRIGGRAAGVVAAGTLALLLAGGALAGSAQRSALRTTVVVTDRTLTVSRASMLEGVVTFVAVNRGRKPHALAIKGPSLNLRTPMLATGKSARLTVLLRPGRYTLWDPVALGKARQRFLRVTAPPKLADPSVARPPSGPGWDPDAYWDCALDIDDERC